MHICLPLDSLMFARNAMVFDIGHARLLASRACGGAADSKLYPDSPRTAQSQRLAHDRFDSLALAKNHQHIGDTWQLLQTMAHRKAQNFLSSWIHRIKSVSCVFKVFPDFIARLARIGRKPDNGDILPLPKLRQRILRQVLFSLFVGRYDVCLDGFKELLANPVDFFQIINVLELAMLIAIVDNRLCLLCANALERGELVLARCVDIHRREAHCAQTQER